MDAALAHFARQSMDDDRIGGDGADGAYDGGAFAGDDEVSYDRMVPVGLSGGDGLPAVATSSEQMTFGGSLLGGAGDSSTCCGATPATTRGPDAVRASPPRLPAASGR